MHIPLWIPTLNYGICISFKCHLQQQDQESIYMTLWQLVGGMCLWVIQTTFIIHFLCSKEMKTTFYDCTRKAWYICKSIQLLSPICRMGGSPSLFASHLLRKSQNFTWICVKRCKWCEMQIYLFLFLNLFCIGDLPTANDLWSNQQSLDPLSYRCVCNG